MPSYEQNIMEYAKKQQNMALSKKKIYKTVPEGGQTLLLDRDNKSPVLNMLKE